MTCQMMDLLSCNREAPVIMQKCFRLVKSHIAVRSAYPPRYVEWVRLMISDGTALFRLYTLLIHVLFDDVLRDVLFEGAAPTQVIEFVERLQDVAYNVFLGRTTDGSTMTTSGGANAEHQRTADIVLAMQEYYISR